MSASIRIAPNNGLHSHNYRVLYNDLLGPFSLQSGITPNSSVTLSNVYVLFHAGLSGGCHHSYPVARTSPRPRSKDIVVMSKRSTIRRLVQKEEARPG